ncbi:MAG: hypothetical protein GX624_08240 [Actinobacteria bacterium]|nr:hypothetical protein [Actinomycetota bacterium]
MKRSTRAALTVSVLCTAFLALAVPAAAHETGTAGKAELSLGWGTEPAYVGQLNTVQLMATYADGDPVNDPGARLTVRVRYGEQEQESELVPTYDPDYGTGTPGEYAAFVIPTAPGNYTFHVTGRIAGSKVDMEVTSSPRTFSPVEDASAVQFPVKVPGTEQVAARLDNELPRMAAASAVTDVESEVSAAKTIGYVGIAAGVAGLALAAVALLVRRRA